jgi:hypothetical protein
MPMSEVGIVEAETSSLPNEGKVEPPKNLDVNQENSTKNRNRETEAAELPTTAQLQQTQHI